MTIEETKKGIVVGYLGPKYSFSHKAIEEIFATEYQPFPDISVLLQAFYEGDIDKAVVPLENSTEGIVSQALDSLIKERDRAFCVEGEVIIPINQCLIGTGKITKINKVISHPQALAQCREYLEKLRVKTESAFSTSAAVKLVSEVNDSSVAAIGTEIAAKMYGLKVLAANIQDNRNNRTKFVILSQGKNNSSEPTGNDKTLFVFEFSENKAGDLHDITTVFKALGINMLKLISRPSRNGSNECNAFFDITHNVIYVETQGHEKDRKLSMALEQIEELTGFMRVFGSYPRAKLGGSEN